MKKSYLLFILLFALPASAAGEERDATQIVRDAIELYAAENAGSLPPCTGTGADFTTVGAITLLAQGPEDNTNPVDLQFSNLQTTSPAITATKEANPDNDPALPGDTIRYTITVTNPGSTIQTGIVVTDPKEPAPMDVA